MGIDKDREKEKTSPVIVKDCIVTTDGKKFRVVTFLNDRDPGRRKAKGGSRG